MATGESSGGAAGAACPEGAGGGLCIVAMNEFDQSIFADFHNVNEIEGTAFIGNSATWGGGELPLNDALYTGLLLCGYVCLCVSA